jgi:hypothetical protein
MVVARHRLGVPCPSIGPLHRGSISTDAASLWFIGQIDFGLSCGDHIGWAFGKFSMGALTAPPYTDPSPKWYVETTPVYRDSSQYAVGVNHEGGSSVVRLMAMRSDPVTGQVLPPFDFDTTVSPWVALPSQLASTGTPIDDFPSEAIWKAVYRDGYVWATHCVGTGGTTNRSVVR